MATVARTNESQNPHFYAQKGRARNGATLARSRTLCVLLSASEPGRFGVYGGRYVPETLMAALEELEREYERAKRDPKFQGDGWRSC